MADSKYLMGRKLADLGPGAPSLEAAAAACALAQGELGHARLLYRLSADLRGEASRSLQSENTIPKPGRAFRFIETAELHWVDLIVALYVTDAAIGTVVEVLLASGLSEVLPLRKLVEEQRLQLRYAEGWVQALAHESGRLPAKLDAALAAMLPEAEQWLVAAETTGALVQIGVTAATGESPLQLYRRRVALSPTEFGVAMAP